MKYTQFLIAALLLSATPALSADPPAVPTGPAPKPKLNVGEMLKKLFSFTTPAERSEAFLPSTYAFKSPSSGLYVTQLSGVIGKPSTPKAMLNAAMSFIERQFGLLEKGAGPAAIAFRKKVTYLLCVPTVGQGIAGVTWKYGDERARNSLPAPSAVVEKDGSFLTGLVRVPPTVKPGEVLNFNLYEDSKRTWNGGARVHLIPPTGWTVVSDIDDTLRIATVTNLKLAFINTFVKPYVSVPNVVDAVNSLLKKLSTKDNAAVLQYLSGSPIALLPTIQEWIEKSKLPLGPVELQKTTLNSFANAKKLKQVLEYKTAYLARLLRDFPQRRFVFIGDSTQTDPAAYGATYRDMVKKGMKPACIYIRVVEGVNPNKEKELNKIERFLFDFQQVNANHWMLYKDAAELKLVDPTSGSCYPKGKQNPHVPAKEALKPTRPAIGKDGKTIQPPKLDSTMGNTEFESVVEVLAPYYAKFASFLQ